MSTEDTKNSTGQAAGKESLRKIPLLLIGILIIVIVALVAFKNRTQSSMVVCSDDVLRKAAAAQDVTKIQELKLVVDTIKGTKYYEQDASCVYPLVRYDLNLEDPTAAQHDLDILKASYQPSVGFRNALGLTKSPLELQASINVLKKSQDSQAKHPYIIDTVPSR